MMHLLNSRDESAERAAEFLRTVAHAGRLRIVCALMEQQRSASELAIYARLAAPALSQQAAILEAKGILARRREGRSVMYSLASPEAEALAEFLYRMFCKPSPTKRRRQQQQRS
jgi:DNA-binding transcriptional ArsR family regulator